MLWVLIGWQFTLAEYVGGIVMIVLMFVTIVIAAPIVNGIFSGLGLIPTEPRPTRTDIFSSVQVNYKLALNLLGVTIFAALFWLTARRGATDPVCEMKVDRHKALTTDLAGHIYYFCGEHCLHAFQTDHDGHAHTRHEHAHSLTPPYPER